MLSAPVATAVLARLVHRGPINDAVSALIFFGAPLVFLVAIGGLVRLPRRASVGQRQMLATARIFVPAAAPVRGRSA